MKKDTKRIIPNYQNEVANQIFDRIIETFGIIKGINVAASRMERIPVDRAEISDTMITELINRSDEFEELLKAAGILKNVMGSAHFDLIRSLSMFMCIECKKSIDVKKEKR